jgi:hypothetical protein
MEVTADRAAIASLPGPEQAQVLEMLAEIRAAVDTGRLFLTADRLRGMIRNYVESLRAIRVRPTGGVYFTGRQHAGTLAALRELVKRFGTGSSLTRIPLPDQEEMREMVISAFVTGPTRSCGSSPVTSPTPSGPERPRRGPGAAQPVPRAAGRRC